MFGFRFARFSPLFFLALTLWACGPVEEEELTDEDLSVIQGELDGACNPERAMATAIEWGGAWGQDMIAEALDWVYRGIPYSQTKYTDGYRQDCSGMVSKSWRLGANATTATLENYAYHIPREGLVPGDILLKKGHTSIHAYWMDEEHTRMCMIQQSRPGRKAELVVFPSSTFRLFFNLRKNGR